MTSHQDSFRQRLTSGEPVLGPWCVVPSVASAVAVASSGMDFAIVDMEHGSFDTESMLAYVHALRSQGCAALVRPSGGTDPDMIQKALDGGADGIVIPSVRNVEDAERILRLARYSPRGNRGFSPFTPAGSMFGQESVRYRESANERISVIGILESEEAIENLDGIVAVGAFDALYIGAYDLSSALGFQGDVYHHEFREVFLQIVSQAKASGVPIGGYVARTEADVRWLVDAGLTFITCEVDLAALMTKYTTLVTAFRESLK